MKVKLNVTEINSAKEQAMVYYLDIMLDDFMFLMKTFKKLEEIDEKDEI